MAGIGGKAARKVGGALVALLPSPLAIAVVLTGVTFLLAFLFTNPAEKDLWTYSSTLRKFWYEGMWNTGMLAFAVQTMLMLILGHVLALTPLVARAVDLFVSKYCSTTSKAAFTVTLLTVVVGLFNWGLGLIFGAIFARKVGEYATKNGLRINYPLIGAAGFSGLMVWHGGISGISLAKAAEPGHLRGLLPEGSPLAHAVPEYLTYSETMFSPMNLTVSLALLVLLPISMFLLGKKAEFTQVTPVFAPIETELNAKISGAERLDYSLWFGSAFGVLVLWVAFEKAINHPLFSSLGFIDPNWINLFLLGLALLMHRSIHRFTNSIEDAIGGAAGILIQFPLYFGIMGIMTHSGLVQMMSDFFVRISDDTTYHFFTFVSAGIVNVFVPSGGGQWAIQGGIIVRSAAELGVSMPKAILAMAYGDQLTNMLQPFWALPLLGITGLKAKEILPYTLFLMLIGGAIFSAALFLF